MTKIDNLLKGINLADLDGVKSIEVSLKDLQLLRRELIKAWAIEDALRHEKSIVSAKLGLCQLEKPIRLDTYC